MWKVNLGASPSSNAVHRPDSGGASTSHDSMWKANFDATTFDNAVHRPDSEGASTSYDSNEPVDLCAFDETEEPSTSTYIRPKKISKLMHKEQVARTISALQIVIPTDLSNKPIPLKEAEGTERKRKYLKVCGVCLEVPHRPRVMQCGHAFCLFCVKQLSSDQMTNKFAECMKNRLPLPKVGSMTCPYCKTPNYFACRIYTDEED